MAMETLCEGAKALGLTLSARHVALFELYYRELAAWNRRFNLTAITAYDQVQSKHFLDSLTCLLALPRSDGDVAIPATVPLQTATTGLWLMDVGSGAGFPGLPLKIMLPEARVTLVESVGKKVTFLRHAIEVLGLTGVEVLAMRAEEAARLPEHRERYDMVVARAVAHLSVLAEYCLPCCRIGGRMVAPKGEDAASELGASRLALEMLGCTAVALTQVHLPGAELPRYLVVADKGRPTPEQYPRRVGLPTKRPLH
jgi:16S rRNA (guanine527-N7)-methyltransferase